METLIHVAMSEYGKSDTPAPRYPPEQNRDQVVGCSVHFERMFLPCATICFLARDAGTDLRVAVRDLSSASTSKLRFSNDG